MYHVSATLALEAVLVTISIQTYSVGTRIYPVPYSMLVLITPTSVATSLSTIIKARQENEDTYPLPHTLRLVMWQFC